MAGQAAFFDVDERLKKLSAKGDDLERLSTLVDFVVVRGDLERAVPRKDRAKSRRSRRSITCSCSRFSFCRRLRRWVVERTVAWLNRNRRLAKEFEAAIESAET